MSNRNDRARSRHRLLLALGVSVCLLAAIVMVAGASIFGGNHTGIATVVGIIGIGLIASSSKGRVAF